jgi:propanediol dehydratase small subunit
MDVVNSSINALNALAGKLAPATTSSSQTPVDTKSTSVRDHPYGSRGASKKTAGSEVDDDTNLVVTLKQAVAAQQHAVALQQQQQQAAVAAAVLQQQSAAAAMVSACSTIINDSSSPSINQQNPNSCNGNDENATIIR